MMKRKHKLLALILILAMPAFIFLFLKMFGRNEFTIPVYYETGVPADTLGCTYPAEAPYRVTLSQPVNGMTLVLFDGGNTLMPRADRNNLIRRMRQSGPAGLNIVVYFNKEAGAPIPLEGVFYVPKSPDTWGTLRCLFVTSAEKQLILLDDQGRIRGYFELDREEVDRLLVELDILDVS